MEEQLAAYRARKEKEHKAGGSLFPALFKRSNKEAETKITEEPTENLPLASPVAPIPNAWSTEVPEVKTWRDYLFPALYVTLWFVIWMFFVEIEFGAVYFIISVAYFMYINTRTGPKKPNRLSAYSVFNPNQERLDGTFTAEQFEKELRFGPASVN